MDETHQQEAWETENSGKSNDDKMYIIHCRNIRQCDEEIMNTCKISKFKITDNRNSPTGVPLPYVNLLGNKYRDSCHT